MTTKGLGMEWREQTRILTIVSTPRFVNHHRWVHRWVYPIHAPSAEQVLLHGHRAQLGQAVIRYDITCIYVFCICIWTFWMPSTLQCSANFMCVSYGYKNNVAINGNDRGTAIGGTSDNTVFISLCSSLWIQIIYHCLFLKTWVLEGALEATRPVATGPSASKSLI